MGERERVSGRLWLWLGRLHWGFGLAGALQRHCGGGCAGGGCCGTCWFRTLSIATPLVTNLARAARGGSQQIFCLAFFQHADNNNA